MQKNELDNRLKKFCRKYEKIYLYGAGNYARRYFSILQKIGITITGVVITLGEKEAIHGLPIYTLAEFKNMSKKSVGMILALSKKNHSCILNQIKKCNIEMFYLEDEELIFLYNRNILLPSCCKENKFHLYKPNIDMNSLKKILVIRIDVLGDLLMTIPFIRELKYNFANSEITLVIRDSNYELMKDCPYISKLLIYKCDGYDEIDEQKIKSFSTKYLIHENYDIVFLPREFMCGRNYVEECVLAFYSHARYCVARMRAFEWSQQKLYSIASKLVSFLCYQKEPMHEVMGMLDMLKKFGLTVKRTNMEYWTLKRSELDVESFIHKVRTDESTMLVAVGLVASSPNRSWNSVNYIELMRRIHKKFNNKIQFVLFGGSDAKQAAKAIVNANIGASVLNFTDRTTLAQLALLMDQCSLYLGSDTGLMHFAVALGKYVIELSIELADGQPTDGASPARMGPWGVKSQIIQPLGLDDCRGFCKKSYAHCINTISVQTVETALERYFFKYRTDT